MRGGTGMQVCYHRKRLLVRRMFRIVQYEDTHCTGTICKVWY